MTINNLCPIIELYLLLSRLELFSESISFQSQALAKPQILAANTTANHKSSSGGGSPLPNTASSHAGLDKFGIKEIYPTKQGGREWYISMSNPRNDNIFLSEPVFPMRT